VWGEVQDRNGVPKTRPLLVIRPLPIVGAGHLWCLAISTDTTEDPADPGIEMPWAADGSDPSGLMKWCRVILTWRVSVLLTDAKLGGTVTREFFEKAIEFRERFLAFGPSK
jgi:hypothetical protein